MFTAVQKVASEDEQKLPVILSQLYKAVLEKITTQASLSEVLDELCRFMEKHFPELLCSVLILDSDGKTLRHGGAPSLPPEYSRAIDGVQIGPSTGSCGTAAFRGQPVIVTDIANDELWKDYSSLALSHGLKACWSTPILARAGKVLGTFAVYYREPRSPDPRHIQMVEGATHLAGIAIEREQAEGELRAAETRYRTLVERLPAVTYIAEVGVLGRWQYVSPQIETILGFSPKEWLADSGNWINHIHPEDRDRALAAENRFWEVGGMYRAEYRMHAKDGRVLWFRDDAVLLRNIDSEMPLMQGVLYDVTAYKQLEDQLRQSQKMEAVGKLAGGVAHDFNNLLMVIQGHNEHLLGQLPSGEPAQHAFEIKEAVVRAASLTRQLLAFSRKQVLQPHVLDMNTVLRGVGKMLERLIGANIEIKVITAQSLWRVKADRSQVEQVIVNLALNARDAMPFGGKLTIETSNVEIQGTQSTDSSSARPGKYVVLTVSDTGIGMDAETQSHVFEPFFSTKELGKGTGLGLASVYGVVKQSGGWISFRSQVGVGTNFQVYLPQAQEQLTLEKAEPAPASLSKGTETILVAEDQEEIRELIGECLGRNGYNVLRANNGTEALRIAAEFEGTIHLLVTDMVMPQTGGRELARRLIQLRPQTKVLFISGYPEHAVVTNELVDPGALILQKPFSLDVLAGKVRAALDSAGVIDLPTQSS